VRAAHPNAGRRLVEVVLRPDVLERQEPAGLDLQHLPHIDRREGSTDPLRVGDHRGQRVHALDLRGQQVVARVGPDPCVPGNLKLGEQRERLLTDVRKQVERRMVSRQGGCPAAAPSLVTYGAAARAWSGSVFVPSFHAAASFFWFSE